MFLGIFFVSGDEREDQNNTKSGRFAGGPMMAQH